MARATQQLDDAGVAYGPVELGAMIEVPAAALMLPSFLRYFDFVSIGTNDLIQYTLAIDRADESVAHLYDPWHPAVLQLMARDHRRAHAQGKGVSVCGEMAGDAAFTELLLAMGLRSFSMHPSQIAGGQAAHPRADASRWCTALRARARRPTIRSAKRLRRARGRRRPRRECGSLGVGRLRSAL